MDLGTFFDEEEKRLLDKAKAEIAAEQADPVFQAKVKAQIAAREAEAELPRSEEVDEEDEDDDGEDVETQ